jgi:hypothetical protein
MKDGRTRADELDQRGFAATAVAHDGDELSIRNIQADIL